MSALFTDDRGSVAIETAFVAPLLLLMGLGAFESSMMVARQVELQNAAAEASQIALAAAPTDEIARATVKQVIETSTNLPPENVDVLERYRCDTQPTYVTESNLCSEHYARFIQIRIRDQYVPCWAQITTLGTVDYNVVRMVQVG